MKYDDEFWPNFAYFIFQVFLFHYTFFGIKNGRFLNYIINTDIYDAKKCTDRNEWCFTAIKTSRFSRSYIFILQTIIYTT